MTFFIDAERFNNELAKHIETEKELRRKAGVSVNSWYAAKKGNGPLDPKTVNRLAALLKVKPNYLVKRAEDRFLRSAVVSS